MLGLSIDCLAAYQAQLNQAAAACGGRLTVFFSVCNGHERARVFHHSGPDWQVVWLKAQANLLQFEQTNLPWLWLRIDWVSNIQTPIAFKQWQQQLTNVKRNYYRSGIAFDEHLEVALTEQELNANACLYMGAQVPHAACNEKNMRHYLKRRFGAQSRYALHDDATVWSFQTAGCFINLALFNQAHPSLAVYTLDTIPGNQGRRVLQALNADDVGEVISTASQFLSTQVRSNGRFVYGHFPVFGLEISAYNTLRHASTVYAMLEAWEYTHDAALMQAIERAIDYLLNNCIRTYTLPNVGQVAFNVEIDSQEIKLGASAVAILALVKYDQLTGNVQHLDLLTQLALGIAAMQNPQTGRFVHVLHADSLQVKEAFRIVYYDGEAAFALMRLYGLTRDDRWLALVQNAFEYFIEAEHWKHHDHWLSYCVNELTLYKPEFKYFKFGVQNIAGYLNFIENRQTTFPTLLELCMAFEHMLRRIQSTPSLQPLLNGFDVAHFFRAMHRRANHLMNGYFFPEVAMYFKKPNTIVGSFFIRHHSFRVRIDDVEHYLSGLVAYRKFLLQQVAETDTNHATIKKLPILAWGGDVNLARRMHRRVCDLPLLTILNVPALQQADFALVNLECVVAWAGQQGIDKGEGGPYYFRARPDMLRILQEANIKAVVTANNHSGDYGPEALHEQAYWLEQAGIQFTGSGRNAAEAALPLFVNIGDVRVAIFGFDTTQKTFAATEHQAGTNFIDLSVFPTQTKDALGPSAAPMQALPDAMVKLRDAFQQAKTVADLVVVAMHWGPNLATQPTPAVRNAARWLVELGADAILGSSSHVLQGIEVWQGCPIIFDAGDLLFDSRVDAKGKPGAVFHLHLSKQGVQAVEVFRLRVGYGQTQQLAAVADEVVHIKATQRKKNIFAKSGLSMHAILNLRLPAAPPTIAAIPQRWQIAEVPSEANMSAISLGPLLLKGLRLSPRVLKTRTMIWVETFWEILAPTDQDVLLDMQVVCANGQAQHVFGAGSDHQLCDWQLPTTAWQPNHIYRDYYGLRPPKASDMKPGRYVLSLRILQGSKAIAGVSFLDPIVVEESACHLKTKFQSNRFI